MRLPTAGSSLRRTTTGAATVNESNQLVKSECLADLSLRPLVRLEGVFRPDSGTDPRRTAADAVMRQHGAAHAASALGMYAAVTTYPVHNPHTAYTAIMHARTGELHAYVRQAMCPEIGSVQGVVLDSRYCQSGR